MKQFVHRSNQLSKMKRIGCTAASVLFGLLFIARPCRAAEASPEASPVSTAAPTSTDAQVKTGVEKKGDAADPTDVSSSISLNLEWQRHEHSHGRTDTYGLRFMPSLGISSALMLVLEMPFAYADNSRTKNDATGEGKADNLFGIGDVRARVFYVPYKKVKRGLTAVSASVDIFAPSGKAEYYMGSAGWVVAPGLALGFAVTKWFQVFPILSYNAVMPDRPGTGRDVIHNVTLQAYLVFRLPQHLFVQLAPFYAQTVAPETAEAFNTEFIFGWQPGAHGLKIRYQREFISDTGVIDQVRLGYTYYY